MKVCILTFIDADNYGAVLQACALQKYISSLHHECCILQYYNRNIWIQFHNRRISESKNLLQYIKTHVRIALNHKRHRNFELFRGTLNLSKRVDLNSVADIVDAFDKIIVGSDQVWNPRNTAADKTFLLDFFDDNNKKIAYAASFGNTEFFNEFGDDAIKRISCINHISVRESEGHEFLDGYGISNELVVDPVLLLKNHEWKAMTNSKYNNEEYIFVYQLRPLNEIVEFAIRLSKKTGLKIYVLPFLPSVKKMYKWDKNTLCVYDSSPTDFISLICNAKYVVTDSFHGMALSICMHTNFYVYLDNCSMNTSSRIKSLLDVCDLTNDRIIQIDSEIDLHQIDFDIVEDKVNSLRLSSFAFIHDALTDIET